MERGELRIALLSLPEFDLSFDSCRPQTSRVSANRPRRERGHAPRAMGCYFIFLQLICAPMPTEACHEVHAPPGAFSR